MNRRTLAGIGLFVAGLAGYVVGISTAYPGRAFSITAVMLGIALAATGRQSASRRDA
ncbi:hypothetical protein [Haloprofundus salilacus]|uniref:hypothetical protein n=1 Tax=Haloprofundus salilacus TaxID=2876190 RepID=UPI001CCD77DA|nr:hypothetical protein [Haloprofundus salilacus]